MVTPLFRVETRAAQAIESLTGTHIQHTHLPGIQRVTPLFRVETPITDHTAVQERSVAARLYQLA